MAPEELTSLIASASHQYALKHYEAAADLYSRATSVQAELNGEMNIENADLLYAYGRCLYHVAITNSDVLGGKVAGPAGDAKKGEKRKRQGAAATAQGSSAAQGAQLDVLSKKHADVVEKVVETAVEGKSGMNVAEKEQQAKEESKPFFEITGDDDEWQDEDEDEDTEADEAAQGEEDEEEDDFATAYEILEMARILLSKKVETLSEENGQDAANTRKDADDSPFRKALSSLADTHDLQAEISLENERFTDAVSDARSSLQLKEKLYPPESSLVAEAHFKLSLALEFASATEPKNSTDAKAGGEGQSSTSEQQQQPDEEATKALREDSVSHMEAAIKSSEGRVDLERKKLADLKGEEAEKARRSIKDVEEIVKDMKQRVRYLRLISPINWFRPYPKHIPMSPDLLANLSPFNNS